MGAVSAVMAGKVVLVLALGAVSSAPLTEREKQNRIVAVSQSDASLLSAAVSKASPDLLRVALTASEPDLLQTALTVSDPELLIAALNNVDPDLLAVALTKSEKDLLTTALTEAKVELLQTALNAPTNSAILEVALTLSNPELLKIALQDATVENLIVALTASDGSTGTASTSARLTIKDQVDSAPSNTIQDASSEESIESVVSIESDQSEESGESEEYPSTNDIIELKESLDSNPPKRTQSSDYITSPGFNSYPAVPDEDYEVPSHKKQNRKDPEGVPYGALSNSVQTRLANAEEKVTQHASESYNQLPVRDNIKQSHSSLQTRLVNTVPQQSVTSQVQSYQHQPLSVSGGKSYHSGWSHARVLGPVNTFPFYVSGKYQYTLHRQNSRGYTQISNI